MEEKKSYFMSICVNSLSLKCSVYVNIFSEIVVVLLSKTALSIEFNLHLQYFHPHYTIVCNSASSFVTTKKGIHEKQVYQKVKKLLQF